MARVHAVLRRSSPPVEQVTLGDVTVDFRQHDRHARAATTST